MEGHRLLHDAITQLPSFEAGGLLPRARPPLIVGVVQMKVNKMIRQIPAPYWVTIGICLSKIPLGRAVVI